MSGQRLTFQQFLTEFHALQNRLLTMPEEEALSETFTEEQDKLSHLLAQLSSYSSQDQETARREMREFADKLSHKLTALKRRMEQLSGDMSAVETRTRGIKAYNQGKIF
jgi:esterase/lipase